MDSDNETPERRDTSRRDLLKGVAAGALGTAGLVGGVQYRDDLTGVLGHETSPVPDAVSIDRLVSRDEVTHAATGGRWSDETAWGGSVPGDDARVHVPDGVELTVDATTARVQSLRVDGRLRVGAESASHLRVESLVVTDTGRLSIGTPDDPASDARVTFLDSGPLDEGADPERMGRGLLTLPGATVRAHGIEKTPYLETEPPTAGVESLTLAAEPVGWSVGDTVVVPGLSPDENEDEERTLTEVAGATVRFDAPLEYDHLPPSADLPAYAVNLDRSVRLESESERTKRRGHVLFMNRDTVLEHVGMYDLGRTDKSRPFTDPVNGTPPADAEPNPQARYACHFHRTDPEATPQRLVRGCVVWGSPGWGYVNHDSNVRFEENVSYEVFGAGFVAEIGTEAGAFLGNFALRSQGSGDVPDGRQFTPDHEAGIDDFGHGGYGFWLQGPGVRVEENVAAGHRHHGFVYWTRPKPDRAVPAGKLRSLVGRFANFPVERVDGQPTLSQSDRVEDGKVPSSFVRFRSFRANTVFASGGGLDISRHQFSASHEHVEEYSVVDDFTAFNLGRHYSQWDHLRVPNERGAQGGYNGISVRYSANVVVRNARLVAGDGAGRGVGVNRNHAPSNVRVEESSIEGFAVGVRAAPRGDGHVSGTFDNEVDIHVVGGTTDRRWTPAQRVDIDATFGDGGRTNVFMGVDHEGDLYGLFAPDGEVTLNGERLYFAEQAPDYVPIPTRSDLQTVDTDALSALSDVAPRKLVGESNRDLEREYGLAVEGRVLPANAGTHSGVESGYIPGGARASTPASPLVTRVASGQGSLWEVGRLAQGERLYVYGEERFRTVPGKYTGATYVRPERGDAGLERRSAFSLDLSAPSTVYVAYDAEGDSEWLSSWRRTGDTLTTTDGKRDIFARDVAAGTVTLGGCPDSRRMYTAFAQRR